MALVQYGGGILDMRGSIGGQVHSRNRYGNYTRARTTPVNPSTDRQSQIRAAISALASRWSTVLTALQRAEWEVYAAAITRVNKLGGQIKLTGFNHYIRSNAPRSQLTLPIHEDGPGNLTLPGADPLFACTVDEAGQQISVVFDATLPWDDQDDGRLIVSMSIPKATGVKFVGGPFRVAGTITGVNGAPTASPQVIPVPFPVTADQVVKCSARISEDDGRLSDPFFDQSNVTA